jgi:hypothetical protein
MDLPQIASILKRSSRNFKSLVGNTYAEYEEACDEKL